MYSKNEEEIFKILNSNTRGLDSKETEKRLKDYGQNIILNKKKKIWILRFLKQFNDTMIIILLVVALLLYFYGCFYSHEYTDTIVILFVVFINAIVGFIQEEKATLVLRDLKKYETSTCKVKRDDKIIVINTKELVPGDIIYLESGETVPADIRILSCESLKVDESALTGESVPVQKSSDVLKNNLILQEQKNMLFLGTSITNGKSTGIVVSTGKNTEIGKIALSLNEIDRIETPLQLKIKELSKKITFIVFIILIFIFILALINKYTILEIIMLCSSLAVAAIPEGLPAVITITLSVGIFLTYFISLKMYGQETAMSLALLSMVVQEIVYSISCRNLKESVVKQGLFSNKAMNYGLLLILLIELIVFVTPIGKLISITSIDISLILIVFLINFMAIFIYELIKPFLVKRFKD